MIPLVCGLLLWIADAWAQQPALTLVAGRDSLGVGDTLEVRVEVDARGRMLTSASAIVALARGIFVPLSETPFTAGDFMPGQIYDNTAAEDGEELLLSFVAVSGTGEDGGRLAASGQGELGRFRVLAVAPSAGTLIRLVGTGAQRSIYTAPDQPGVEQRFALPEQALRLLVGGGAEVVQLPVEIPPADPVQAVLPEPPAPASAPVNAAPRIIPIAPLAVAVGGESYGPLLAGFLSDAEDEFEALRVEVVGDALVAARVEGGRLVVRGLRAGAGLVQVRVEDTQGAQVDGQVEVEVRAAGQGPLLRALPKMVLEVGGEKILDLAAYVFDLDTPLAALSWTIVPEGGVEASLAGTQLQLRGLAAGSARISLQVADPEGNMALATLVLQLEEQAIPAAAPPDTAAVSVDSVPGSTPETVFPDADPPQESIPPDSAATAPTYPSAQSGSAIPDPQEENQDQLNTDAEEPAAQAAEEGNHLQPGADAEEPVAPAGEGETSGMDTVQAPQNDGAIPAVVVSPEPGAVDTARTDSVRALPETDTAPPPAAERPPAASPFSPIVDAPALPAAPPEEHPVPAPPPEEYPVPAPRLLEVEPAVEYQVLAGRVDSGLVADCWVKRGEPGQVQWSLRGGKQLLARLDADTRRLYLDARGTLPGRQVLFAEAVLGQERQQVRVSVDVRAPRLVLLPLPALELAEGQQLALALDSYVEGDFDPAELSWTMEAAEGVGAELDAGDRVLRLRGSGSFSLVLKVSSPWGNEEEVLIQVRGAVPPDTAPPPTAPTPPEPIAAPSPAAAQPEPQTPVSTPVSTGPPTDNRPPLLRLEQVALGEEVELWVRADEELRSSPVVRVNGQVLEVEGAGSEYRALYTPQGSQLQVQVEGEDLAGNAGQTLAALVVQQVQPGSARLRSLDGRWQAYFPQVRREALVLFRDEGEAQRLDFDAERTGPVELVAMYSGEGPPAILRAQGEEWEGLSTYALTGGQQVFARSERGGAFKLGGRATQVLPAQPLVYPNPFNAQAAIRYQVTERGAVRVRVRDGQGRIVRQLVDQIQDPGVWTAPWDGRDGAGQGAASGVYFCEVQVAGQRWTGKLLLLR